MMVWPHDDDDDGVEITQWCTHVFHIVQVFVESRGLLGTHANACFFALR